MIELSFGPFLIIGVDAGKISLNERAARQRSFTHRIMYIFYRRFHQFKTIHSFYPLYLKNGAHLCLMRSAVIEKNKTISLTFSETML